jgi:S-formylglutathione hydrolase FrmB
MMAGAPGQPRDWIDGGQLATVMDAYAAEHAGLAPVIVVVDNLGASFANPACVDSPLGNVLTYLRVDVPQWIKSNLQVDQDAEQWAVGGLSSGGTCALLLAVNAPDVYRSFVSISGEDRVTIGDPTKTLTKLFGGSQSAFDAVDPLSVMKSTTFPDTAGFVVGGTDDTYLPQAKRVAAAGTAAGMTITYVELPGGHEWRVWGAGFVLAVPWLAMRTGLVVR